MPGLYWLPELWRTLTMNLSVVWRVLAACSACIGAGSAPVRHGLDLAVAGRVPVTICMCRVGLAARSNPYPNHETASATMERALRRRCAGVKPAGTLAGL